MIKIEKLRGLMSEKRVIGVSNSEGFGSAFTRSIKALRMVVSDIWYSRSRSTKGTVAAAIDRKKRRRFVMRSPSPTLVNGSAKRPPHSRHS